MSGTIIIAKIFTSLIVSVLCASQHNVSIECLNFVLANTVYPYSFLILCWPTHFVLVMP